VFVRGVRLVDVHHHGPLEVRHGSGYCVQTLEQSHVAGQWLKLTPSAELMVDPGCGARCAIRDTGAPGEAVTIGPSPCSANLTQWRQS
jgi:hypothetical protein